MEDPYPDTIRAAIAECANSALSPLNPQNILASRSGGFLASGRHRMEDLTLLKKEPYGTHLPSQELVDLIQSFGKDSPIPGRGETLFQAAVRPPAPPLPLMRFQVGPEETTLQRFSCKATPLHSSPDDVWKLREALFQDKRVLSRLLRISGIVCVYSRPELVAVLLAAAPGEAVGNEGLDARRNRLSNLAYLIPTTFALLTRLCLDLNQGFDAIPAEDEGAGEAEEAAVAIEAEDVGVPGVPVAEGEAAGGEPEQDSDEDEEGEGLDEEEGAAEGGAQAAAVAATDEEEEEARLALFNWQVCQVAGEVKLLFEMVDGAGRHLYPHLILPQVPSSSFDILGVTAEDVELLNEPYSGDAHLEDVDVEDVLEATTDSYLKQSDLQANKDRLLSVTDRLLSQLGTAPHLKGPKLERPFHPL